MASVFTTTRIPVKTLLHLLMEKSKGVQTQQPGENGLLVEISGLAQKIINGDATEVFTENVTCNGVDCQLKLARIPYDIRQIGINDQGLIEFKISEAPKEIYRDPDATKTITRYIDECAVTGTMIEIDSSTNQFITCVTKLYDAVYGRFYEDCWRNYTIDEINMLFMYRKIPYQLCKVNVVDQRYAGHPMPGFTIEKCRW